MTPGVVAAISQAYELVVTTVWWAKSLKVTPDFLQHDKILRTTFAKLVGALWAQNRFNFPVEYKSELNLGNAKIMQYDAIAAFKTLYIIQNGRGARLSQQGLLFPIR